MAGRKILVVVAHPDDCELTCAGSVADWVSHGDRAVLLQATDGARGGKYADSDAEAMVAVRRREQDEAAAVIGFERVIRLGLADGELQGDPNLPALLVEHIRRERPDVAVLMDPTTVIYRNAYINHVDHRTLGMAMLDAMYPAASNAGYFPEQLQTGLVLHKVPETLLCQTDRPNHWVDVSETLETRFRALERHRSQMRLWTDGGQAVIQQQREVAATLGVEHGVRYAEEFRRIVVNPLA